jgi:hypothetical protein
MIPQAPADGYTWVMATISHVVVPHLQSVPYDPLADFQPVPAGQSRLRGSAAALARRRAGPVEGRLRALRQPGQGSRYQGRKLTAM